jgi:PKD repeat protein
VASRHAQHEGQHVAICGWSFGDGVTSTEEHPTHSYGSPGLYSVALTVTNDVGFGVATDTVALYGPPHVDFVARPREGLVPLSVAFTPIVSTTPPGDPSLRYLWHFAVGDGADGTSTLPAPIHTYAATGTYTVSLRVSNTLTSATAVKPAYITVRDTLNLYLPLVARDH